MTHMRKSLSAAIVILSAFLTMGEGNSAKKTKWLTGKVKHEGFPLHLRFPEKPDFDSLQKKYPKLLVVTHTLSKVKPSGEPEADYNASLADFDHELVTALDSPSFGKTLLIETFGGRRTYYIYVSPDTPVDVTKSRFSSKYPQHQLSWELSDDAGWKFIRRYSADYKFYK